MPRFDWKNEHLNSNCMTDWTLMNLQTKTETLCAKWLFVLKDCWNFPLSRPLPLAPASGSSSFHWWIVFAGPSSLLSLSQGGMCFWWWSADWCREAADSMRSFTWSGAWSTTNYCFLNPKVGSELSARWKRKLHTVSWVLLCCCILPLRLSSAPLCSNQLVLCSLHEPPSCDKSWSGSPGPQLSTDSLCGRKHLLELIPPGCF